MTVKLRKPADPPTTNGALPVATEETAQPIPLKPLAIAGVCITKAALIEALRIYVPTLSDLEVIEDGERFLLTVAAPIDSAA